MLNYQCQLYVLIFEYTDLYSNLTYQKISLCTLLICNPYDPCIAYLPTFRWSLWKNVGKTYHTWILWTITVYTLDITPPPRMPVTILQHHIFRCGKSQQICSTKKRSSNKIRSISSIGAGGVTAWRRFPIWKERTCYMLAYIVFLSEGYCYNDTYIKVNICHIFIYMLYGIFVTSSI